MDFRKVTTAKIIPYHTILVSGLSFVRKINILLWVCKSLNLEEVLWRRPIELRTETNTQEEILTVRSMNCRSSCSKIFVKISALKNFAIFTQKHMCWSPF